MSKLPRRTLVLVVLVAVLALVLSVPTSQAATLTSGAYTYVVAGEETVFPYDPIVKKDGYLLPLDVFTALGISAADAQKRNLSLTRGDVTVSVTLGQPWVTLQDGAQVTVAPVPMRVSGRVFLPTQILAALSIDIQTDSSIITLRDLAPTAPTGAYTEKADYDAARAKTTLSGMVKSTEGTFLDIDITYLTPALAASPHLLSDVGTRSRLLHLLDTNTLLLVRVRNTVGTTRGLTFKPESIFIVDNKGMQYEYTGTLIDVKGSLATKLAPSVEKSGILVFQKVNDAPSISFYLYTNPGVLHNLLLPPTA